MYYNYKLPGFTIKPAAIKKHRMNTTTKKVTRLLYCIAHKTEDGWRAHVNTKGLKGFEDITILKFTLASFSLKGRREVFLHKRDKNGHIVHISRTQASADLHPDTPDVFCTLAENTCFSGHIIKDGKDLRFDLHDWEGTAFQCAELMRKSNSKQENPEDDEDN